MAFTALNYDPPLSRGRLVKRYKRFLADVTASNGRHLTMHCPNTGAMTGCAEPGSRVWYSTSTTKSRKYPHTLEIIETSAGHRVGINSALANTIVEEALRVGRLPELDAESWRREVTLPNEAGRIDFSITTRAGTPCWVEVKSVTLALDGGWGAFPDAVSARATRHVEVLQHLCNAGARAVLLFCVQHTGIERVRPAAEVDPRYAAAIGRAVAAGVEVIACGCRIDARGIAITHRLPFALNGADVRNPA